MVLWSIDPLLLEMWLVKNRSTFIIAGVILLVVGVLLLVLKRTNVLQSSSKYVKQKELDLAEQRQARSNAINAEIGSVAMQPGLREDRKITEYEQKKRIVKGVLNVSGVTIGAVVFLIMCVAIYQGQGRLSALIMVFYPIIILLAIVFMIFLANALICAVFDHVIEMCYANQYRIMHYSNSKEKHTPQNVTKPVMTENAEEQGMDENMD